VRRKAIEVRNRANLDSLSARKADKVRDLTNAQIATMKTNTPPEKWEEETLKLVTNGNGQITGFDFSPNAMAEQQIISDGDLATLPELAFAAGSRAISTATIKSETERLTDDFRSGKEGMARRTVKFIEIMRNNGLSSEAIVTLIKAAKEGGKKGREDDAVNAVRNAAAEQPVVATEAIDKELAQRKKGDVENFIDVSSEELLSAKKLAKSTIVSNSNVIQEEFDIAVGQATTNVIDGIRNKTITEADIWSMPIGVDPSKEGDVGAWRSTWATTVRLIGERKRAIQEGRNKDAREKAYDPALVAALKTEARAAKSTVAIQNIEERAAKALSRDFINDDDLESVSVSANATFETAVDKTLDESESQLSGIMLQGTSTVSLVPWLQSQALAITLTGRKFTAEDSTNLLKTFQDVGKAKQWAVDQTRRDVDAEIAKQRKAKQDVSVNDVRLIYLRTQKEWLRKSDTQLTEEYTEWLKRKP
ncbi:hypothetical protein LCGC14_1948870, partial [marine sediment metagenome]